MTSKEVKLRRAAKVCWIVSMLLTAKYLNQIIAANTGWNLAVSWIAACIMASGVQYVITLSESAVFNGTLPPVWHKSTWTQNGPVPWLMAGAIVCLLVDVLLNLGGVSLFTARMYEQNIGQDVLGMSDSFAIAISKVLTVVISIFFAIGSELLDEFANYISTPVAPKEHRHPQQVSVEQKHNNNVRSQRLVNGEVPNGNHK